MKTHKGIQPRRFPAARLVLCVILVAVAASGLATPAQAAGLYTHTWFVERAIERLEAYGGYSELIGILNAYPGIVNYGATFPDVPYTTDADWSESVHDSNGVSNNYSEYLQFLSDHGYDRNNSDLQVTYYAEFLHDPNYTTATPAFRAALMGQLLGSFKNSPRSADDEKKIAFLFGLIAHQEADVPWHRKLPDCNTGWNGLECEVKDIDGVNEVTLDWILHYYDPNNSSNNGYFFYIKSTILAASDAGGFPRPICRTNCPLPSSDPLVVGEIAVEALWTTATSMSVKNDVLKNFLVGYAPGGIDYGSALIAVSWMETWEAMSYTGRYYVKPASSGNANCKNWENACTMQSALSQAVNGEIWAAAGIYKPTENTTDRIASFHLRPGVAIYGGFAGTESARYQRDPAANVTILSGDIDNNDVDTDGDNIVESADDIRGNNSYHVVIGVTGATLDGFVVTAGNADDGANCPSRGCGGGMENVEANVLISNVTFSGNRAVYGGGGMANSNWSSSGSSGSIPSPRITNVTFSGNKAARGGGMLAYKSQPRIANVTFSNNTAEDGGGMLIASDAMDISHATFSANSAGHEGGGAYAAPFDPGSFKFFKFRNSIFWGNTGGQVNSWSEPPSIENSVVQGGCPSGSICTNVSDADPRLGALGDYGGSTPTIPLLPGSSAIDTAYDKDACQQDIEMSGAGRLDQRGVARPQGMACDIGAYEADTTIPTLTSFTLHDPATSPTSADQLVFRVTFSDSVHNVDATDFIVSGTTATITDIAAVSNSEYDITVSGGDLPDLEGTIGLDLAAGQNIADMAENALLPGEPPIDETYLVSNAELYLISFTRQPPAASPTNADVLVFRATFSAVPLYVDKWAFDVTGTTASNILVTPVNTTTYDITVSGGDLASLNGMVGLNLSSGAEICDVNENLMPHVEPAIDETYEVDNTVPSLISFTRQEPPASLTNASALVFRAIFNEAVQNVDAVNFTVSGTTAAGIVVSPVSASVYDLTVAGGDLATYNGTVNLNLAVGQNIQDLAGNALPAGEPAADETYTVEHIAPTVTIEQAAGQADPAITSPINFTAVFIESVMGFSASDVSFAGSTNPGALSANVTGSGPAYNIAVTGMVSGDTVVVSIPSGAADDLAGNASVASISTDNSVTYDTTAPTVTIKKATGQSDPTGTTPINFTAVFIESVMGFSASDVSFAGSTNPGVLSANVTGSGPAYNIAVTGMASGDTVVVSIPAGAADDLAGNASAASTSTDNSVTYDTTVPTVTIKKAAGQSDPTGTTPINFTAVFDESVTGFTTGDVDLSASTAPGTLAGSVTGGPMTYNIAVSGMTGNGMVTASIPAGVAQDAATNLSAASTSTANVLYNTVPPTITSANNVAFTVGTAGSFTVTTTGSPVPAIFQGGALLPGDVTLVDNGDGTATLAGTPAAGSGGVYNMTFTAINGISPNATQNFTLTVYQPPAITSPNNVTFVAGHPSNFILTTTGYPTPAITYTGTLPSGVNLIDNGDGTATLSGTPALSSVDVYNPGFTASYGTLPNATQAFTLTIEGPPGVHHIDSIASTFYPTSDHEIVENEHTTALITTLLVVFNKDMNAGIPEESDDALNVGNYRLAPDGLPDIIIDNVTYDDNGGTGPFVATLQLNGGAALPDGRYILTVKGTIQDTLGAPIGTDFVRAFHIDNTHPHHISAATIPVNNAIIDSATLKALFSSIDIAFDEDINDPASNNDPDDVTNPQNYLLITPGPNGVFDTLNCVIGLTNDDVQIPTGTVTYDNHGGTGPFVATVQLNGGTALPNGLYRLLICGTTSIVDLAGNPLNGGTDTTVTFTIINAASDKIKDSISAKNLPATGFAPNRVTALPSQPKEKRYKGTDLMLEIPVLGVKASIVGVLPSDDGWDIKWLGREVGWLNETAFPTWQGNSVLTAHSYTADGLAGPFANLQKLLYGDQLIIHLNEQKYIFEVRAKKLVRPDTTDFAFEHLEDHSYLTLITCQQYDEKSGKYLYRRIVRAVLMELQQ